MKTAFSTSFLHLLLLKTKYLQVSFMKNVFKYIVILPSQKTLTNKNKTLDTANQQAK